MKPPFVAILIVSISFLAALGGILYWNWSTNKLIERNFEIAVMSQSGHPRSGVEILLNDRIVGKTGAFGTWQGRLQINPKNTFKAIKDPFSQTSELAFKSDLDLPQSTIIRLSFVL